MPRQYSTKVTACREAWWWHDLRYWSTGPQGRRTMKAPPRSFSASSGFRMHSSSCPYDLATFGSLMRRVSRSTLYTAGCLASALASSTTYLICGAAHQQALNWMQQLRLMQVHLTCALLWCRRLQRSAQECAQLGLGPMLLTAMQSLSMMFAQSIMLNQTTNKIGGYAAM